MVQCPQFAHPDRSFSLIIGDLAIVTKLFDEPFKPCDAKDQHSKRTQNSTSKEWGCERLAEQSVSTERGVFRWLSSSCRKAT